jgi:hypothetical protein
VRLNPAYLIHRSGKPLNSRATQGLSSPCGQDRSGQSPKARHRYKWTRPSACQQL